MKINEKNNERLMKKLMTNNEKLMKKNNENKVPLFFH